MSILLNYKQYRPTAEYKTVQKNYVEFAKNK